VAGGAPSLALPVELGSSPAHNPGEDAAQREAMAKAGLKGPPQITFLEDDERKSY
jgi:hypothetical protein